MTDRDDAPAGSGDGDRVVGRDTELDIRAAFESLRHDTGKVDTMAALRELEGRRRWVFPIALGGAVAAVLLLLGLAVFGNDPDDTENVATIDGGDASDGQAPATEGTGSGGDEATELVARLEGTSWVLVEGTGPDGPLALVEDWPVTMTITEATISGTAACNGYGADVTIGNDGGFTVGNLGSEDALCEPSAVMDAESAFLAAIFRVTTVDLAGDGDLVVSGPGVDLRFEPAAAAPQAELVGTAWMLELLIDGDLAIPVEGEPAGLRLDADGTLTGGTGCRDLSGEWIVDGAEILFTTFAADGECRPALADQDGQVVAVLGDGFTADIADGRLVLSSQGGIGLVYVAAESDGAGSGDPDEAAGEDGSNEAEGGGDEVGVEQETVEVLLESEGLGFIAPDSGSISRLPFGSPAGQVLDVLDRLLGEGARSPASPECPNQADRAVVWPETGLQVELRGGELISWSLQPDSELTTLTGIGIGSTRAELEEAYVIELVDSTLGVEFTAGPDPGAPDAIRGLLSGRGNRATVTDLWAGEICAFR